MKTLDCGYMINIAVKFVRKKLVRGLNVVGTKLSCLKQISNYFLKWNIWQDAKRKFRALMSLPQRNLVAQ